MTDLAEFLLARLAEDEAAARAAGGKRWIERQHYAGYDVTVADQPDDHWAVISGGASDIDTVHIARHDPARVLAEVPAKRRIVELHADIHECVPTEEVWPAGGWANGDPWIPCPTLRLLAQPYADHPDFDPAWKVET